MDGLSEDPISFEISNGVEFVGAIIVQPFWEQLHIKYLFVEENYRGQGIARQLMNHALEFGKKRGCKFAFVETMSFQAPEFYQKMGFVIEFSRPGYARDTMFHYLKKTIDGLAVPRKITRMGVYGVAVEDGKILLIEQNRGPDSGKLGFPGGGIEFGESAEQALCREFVEEVAMAFDSLILLDNLTVTIDVSKTSLHEQYTFYQIGMIYRVEGLQSLKNEEQGELQYIWVDPKTLSEERCSSLLWQFVKNHLPNLIKENISIISYDPHVHEQSAIRKLMSYSLYSAEEEKLNRILKAYSSKEQNLFLCFIDHQLIGLIGFDLEGTILHIAVDPAFRCKGIAREMISKNSKRFSEIKAETDKDGIEFYKACGFKVESLGEVYPETERFKCTKQIGKSLNGWDRSSCESIL
jgi:ribosomal protein S18 acetylase RimI-like enzyme